MQKWRGSLGGIQSNLSGQCLIIGNSGQMKHRRPTGERFLDLDNRLSGATQ